MCELLGMSANVPTDIVFSFTGLSERGGRTGPHKDGFGIAFYEGQGVRLFHDPAPSADSEIARLIRRYPIKSTHVIGHIRQANRGPVCLVNTHPFMRELWGQYWVFAHNGELSDHPFPTGCYRPVGNTDSELAFCHLLNGLRQRFHDTPPPLPDLLDALTETCINISRHGIFNILLSNGEWLFSYCSKKLAAITRRAPFGVAQLKDMDMTIDFQALTTPQDIVTVIATEPLTTNERWDVYQTGECRLWAHGECLFQRMTL
jgi:glutamine amidotransferase